MTTKKGNDSDDEFQFDPLEALADVVTGDAFSFFDAPAEIVKDATNDSGAESGAGKAGGGSRGKGESEPTPEPTIKPLAAPPKKGKTAGEPKPPEGGDNLPAGTSKPKDDKQEPPAT